MKVTSRQLRMISMLPDTEIRAALMDLIEEQEANERRLSGQQERTRRWREKRHGDGHGDVSSKTENSVTVTQIPHQDTSECHSDHHGDGHGDHHGDVTAPLLYIKESNVLSTTVVVKERKKVSKSARASPDFVESEFQEWYQNYPNKVGIAPARKAFATARKKASMEDLISGLETYKTTKPAYQAWAHPSTWLNQERWLDCPAEENPFLGRPLSAFEVKQAADKQKQESIRASLAAIRSGEIQIQHAGYSGTFEENRTDGGKPLGGSAGWPVPLNASNGHDNDLLGGNSCDLHGVPGARRGNRL